MRHFFLLILTLLTSTAFSQSVANIDNLVYEIVPNDVVRYGRFMNGQLDFVDNTSIPSSKFEALINDEAFSKLGAFKIRSLPEIEDLSQSLIIHLFR